MWISPSYQDTDFSPPLALEDKITLFEDRVLGWKLYIADRIINGRDHLDPDNPRQPIPHSGYAALDILTSYFEMIAKYIEGYVGTHKSKAFFKIGVANVFPGLYSDDTRDQLGLSHEAHMKEIDGLLTFLYETVRCGLYHSGRVQGRVILDGSAPAAMGFRPGDIVLRLNPHMLVPDLIGHFKLYISSLRDQDNQALRINFQKRFDFDPGKKP
jgi:hypothetical protein